MKVILAKQTNPNKIFLVRNYISNFDKKATNDSKKIEFATLYKRFFFSY